MMDWEDCTDGLMQRSKPDLVNASRKTMQGSMPEK